MELKQQIKILTLQDVVSLITNIPTYLAIKNIMEKCQILDTAKQFQDFFQDSTILAQR